MINMNEGLFFFVLATRCKLAMADEQSRGQRESRGRASYSGEMMNSN
jgi:hypothetical protein